MEVQQTEQLDKKQNAENTNPAQLSGAPVTTSSVEQQTAAANNTQNNSNGDGGEAEPESHLTVEELNIVLLPVFHEIARCIVKDPCDSSSKQRESQEASQKILELEKRYQSARNQIKQLYGIDYNSEDQKKEFESLLKQMKEKDKLIEKYKGTEF